MEESRISFLLRATYDVLPSPNNLKQCLGEDPSYPLCLSPASLRHILTSCKVSLSQGRYTWRHNQVLKCLAATIKTKRVATNALPFRTTSKTQAVPFIWEEQKVKASFINKGCISRGSTRLENVG